MSCSFPAEALLKYRRQLSHDADRTGDQVRVRVLMETVLLIDKLRFSHEDIDGCQCWAAAFETRLEQWSADRKTVAAGA